MQIIRVDGRVVGFIQIVDFADRLYLRQIHLIDGFRGRGIGSTLIGAELKRARRKRQAGDARRDARQSRQASLREARVREHRTGPGQGADDVEGGPKGNREVRRSMRSGSALSTERARPPAAAHRLLRTSICGAACRTLHFGRRCGLSIWAPLRSARSARRGVPREQDLFELACFRSRRIEKSPFSYSQ